MSFYSDASLVLVPSGVKSQKVYSIKPTDGSGDLTFTRNSNATRIGPDGKLEKVRENYVTYSQDFSNAAWTKNPGVTLTAGQTDPNGGTQAFKVDYSAANKELYQYLGSQSGQRTISVYLKGTAGETINLYDGISNSVKTLSASWQRFTITNTFSGGQYISINTYGGNARTIYVAFAQAETGDIATDYIPTTSAAVSVGPTANVPRLNYSNGCPSLLLEPQRTNLATYSEAFGSWSHLNVNVTSNNTTSPSGYTDADKIECLTLGESEVRNTISLGSAGTTYTTSVYAKKGTARYLRIRNLFVNGGSSLGNAWFDLDNVATATIQSGQSATIESFGNGWIRCTLTGTFNGVLYDPLVDIGFTDTNETVKPSATVYGYLYAAQVEVGSYASSYIPTLGASVTRLADAAYKTGISSLIGQTEGTLFLDFDFFNAGGIKVIFSIHDNANNKRLEFWSNGADVQGFIGGSVNIQVGSTTLSNGRHKLALAYKQSGDHAYYVDGVQIGTSSTAYTIAALTAFIFDYWGQGYLDKRYIHQALLFKTRLTNAQLAELTAL